jgi:hypothetical protein
LLHGSALRILIVSPALQLLHRKLSPLAERVTLFRRLHTKLLRNCVSKVYRKVGRKDSENVAMSKHPELPKSGAGSPDVDANREVDPVPAAPPARFGRLALWVASASALAVGVVGTVAYGVWFNHDQRAYVEAMASARQALGITGPTSPTQPTSWSGQVTPSSLPPARGTTVAGADLAPSAASAPFDHRAVPSPDPAAPQLVTDRPGQAGCFAPQKRRHSAPHVKPNGNLFTRIGSFFHRASYRQHGTGSQRHDYSHP